MSKQAAIYIRVSTERQSEKVSPEAQEKDCREYAARKGYQVVEVYRDTERYRVGKKLVEPSGTRADRPAFKRMLADAYAGNFDVIIAWREDRLYRSYRPMLDVLDCLDKTDLDIELVKETFDKRIAPVKAWAAKMELDAKHDRFIMGVSGKLAKGESVFFTPPYGYAKDEDNQFTFNSTESEWLLKIWLWYAEGLPMKEIRQRLVTGGAPQRRDDNKRVWLPSFIYKLLRSEYYYTGLFSITWGGESFEIPLPAIVPMDIAGQVLKRRGEYKNYPAGNLKQDALGAGLCYCFGCNSKLQVVHHQSSSKQFHKVYHYTHYKCHFEARRFEASPDCCHQANIKHIDSQIWSKVWSFISEPDRFEAALQERIEALQTQEVDADSEVTRLSQQLDDMTMERQRVITWGRKGIITESDLETQLLALTFQENGLKRELAQAQMLAGGYADKLLLLAEDYRANVQAGVEAINSLPDGPEAEKQQFEFRRKIVETWVKRVDVFNDKTVKVHLDIDFNLPVSQSPVQGPYIDMQSSLRFEITI